MNIGTFDISKYNINITTTTNEVILTDERKWHILKKHPEVKPYINKINEILSNPDNVYLETTKENTLWLIKKYDQNIKITLKLQVVKNKKYKNSILQMQYITERRIIKYLESGRIKIVNKIAENECKIVAI